ncbi:hypothetical protein ACQEU8_10285 [Streptomyces sp. CA-250714]|uniref:hypothetical protein n=1 Tax=Streptomyces sp. CA-250714 TaxID=3240060 RepID=UPI003D92DE21
MLLVVVLSTGACQSMLQLISLIAEVAPNEQLGYGLAGGVAIGPVATIGMYLSVSHLYAAAVFAALLGFTAGAIVTSGFKRWVRPC